MCVLWACWSLALFFLSSISMHFHTALSSFRRAGIIMYSSKPPRNIFKNDAFVCPPDKSLTKTLLKSQLDSTRHPRLQLRKFVHVNNVQTISKLHIGRLLFLLLLVVWLFSRHSFSRSSCFRFPMDHPDDRHGQKDHVNPGPYRHSTYRPNQHLSSKKMSKTLTHVHDLSASAIKEAIVLTPPPILHRRIRYHPCTLFRCFVQKQNSMPAEPHKANRQRQLWEPSRTADRFVYCRNVARKESISKTHIAKKISISTYVYRYDSYHPLMIPFSATWIPSANT